MFDDVSIDGNKGNFNKNCEEYFEQIIKFLNFYTRSLLDIEDIQEKKEMFKKQLEDFEQKQKEERDRKQKEEEEERERKQKEEEERERLERERKQKEEFDRKQKEEFDRKQKEERDRLERDRLERDRKQKEESERKQKEESERKQKEEREKKQKEERERKQKEEREILEFERLEQERKREEEQERKREEAQKKLTFKLSDFTVHNTVGRGFCLYASILTGVSSISTGNAPSYLPSNYAGNNDTNVDIPSDLLDILDNTKLDSQINVLKQYSGKLADVVIDALTNIINLKIEIRKYALNEYKISDNPVYKSELTEDILSKSFEKISAFGELGTLSKICGKIFNINIITFVNYPNKPILTLGPSYFDHKVGVDKTIFILNTGPNVHFQVITCKKPIDNKTLKKIYDDNSFQFTGGNRFIPCVKNEESSCCIM
jgi:hypothetical protein